MFIHHTYHTHPIYIYSVCVYFSIVQNQIFPSKGAQKLQPLNLGGWIKLMKPWNTGSIAQKGYSWYVTSCGLLINKTSPFLPAILLHRVPGAAPGAVSLALWSGQLAWHSVSLQLRHVMPRLKIGYTHICMVIFNWDQGKWWKIIGLLDLGIPYFIQTHMITLACLKVTVDCPWLACMCHLLWVLPSGNRTGILPGKFSSP